MTARLNLNNVSFPFRVGANIDNGNDAALYVGEDILLCGHEIGQLTERGTASRDRICFQVDFDPETLAHQPKSCMSRGQCNQVRG